MHKSLQRAAVIAAATLAPMAITAAIAPAVSSADCDNGSWWDPVQNRCQAPLVQNCPGGTLCNALQTPIMVGNDEYGVCF